MHEAAKLAAIIGAVPSELLEHVLRADAVAVGNSRPLGPLLWECYALLEGTQLGADIYATLQAMALAGVRVD